METTRDRSIFVNCPFDAAYKPLFDAIVFTISFCGFRARSAQEMSDAGEPRLAKIVRLIAESRFSVHDLSRIEQHEGLPRFNMPIELGIAIGARHLGREDVRNHQLLVLDSERFRYQRFASDLAGIDIHAHDNDVAGVIGAARDFLATQVASPVPGAAAILSALDVFEADLPTIAAVARQEVAALTYADRMQHILAYVEPLQ